MDETTQSFFHMIVHYYERVNSDKIDQLHDLVLRLIENYSFEPIKQLVAANYTVNANIIERWALYAISVNETPLFKILLSHGLKPSHLVA